MNKVVRIEVLLLSGRHQSCCCFHSSPILERKRWGRPEHKSSNYYHKRHNRKSVQDANAFADRIFQRWKDDYNDEDDYSLYSSRTQPFRRTSPWFRLFSDRNKGRQNSKGTGRTFDFWEDDAFEVERIFRASNGANKDFFHDFTAEDFSYDTRSHGKWRHQFDYEFEDPEETHCSATELASYRLTLGLKASGPLRLEDVKNAYRACAFKWHPDRHQGSSKAVAEEKFKTCGAAYQSLCDQLTVK